MPDPDVLLFNESSSSYESSSILEETQSISDVECVSDFVHLHVHSQYSVLDGETPIDKLVECAKAEGMRAVALTDHGVMYGIKEFYDKCNKEKIKPILGCEAYVAQEPYTQKNLRSGNHLIILAKNLIGYKNLVKLISLANIDGVYYRPRIDKDLLKKYSNGLIVSSACIAGEIPEAILAGKIEEAEEKALWYKDIFKDDFYLEVMRHPSVGAFSTAETKDVYRQQTICNKEIVRIGEKLGIKVIATNDVHFLREEDAEAHDILLCVSTGKKFSDPNRMRYTRQEWFKSKKEMANLFRDMPEVLANTIEVADKVETYELNCDPIVPIFPIPESFGKEEVYSERFCEADLIDEFKDRYEKLGKYKKVLRIKFESDYLAYLTYEGAKKRWPYGVTAEVQERIDFELNTIKLMGYPGYFLIVWDFIKAAREHGIMVGPGRGSAAGSIVAYCLEITNIDPMKYDLLFERFLNPDRISMPDIDIDFDDLRRGEVLKWVADKYGKDHVSALITFGRMAAKSAIKDVARVLELPLSEANRLAKMVPSTPKITLKKAYLENPELNEEREHGDELVRRTLRLAETLEGCVRQHGVHACGTLISRDPLDETLPMMKGDEVDGLLKTQYDGHYVEKIGLLKMDFLGLQTLSIINSCCEFVKKSRGEVIDLNAIPIDDKKTYELFAAGKTNGLFQFESEGMKKYLKELNPTILEDLVAMNALYRPGPMDYIPKFVRCKNGAEAISYDHPMMEKYLKSTYGVTVYQEQVMLLSRYLGQFTRGESDSLRKAMGKKLEEEMVKLKGKFVSGCLSNEEFMRTCPKGKKAEDIIEKIWGDWTAFAKYAFNKSHSVCYAYVAYQTGYLKVHYPVEFMAAMLEAKIGSPDDMLLLVSECETMGIKVKGPNINTSTDRFLPNIENNTISYSLVALSGVGRSVAKAIVDEREKDGKYKSFINFMERMSQAKAIVTDANGTTREANVVIGRGLQSLICAGAFDECEDSEDRQHLLNSMEAVKTAFSKQKNKDTSQISLFDSMDDVNEMLDSALIDRSSPPMSEIEKLVFEKELLGFYLSGHPFDMYSRLEVALTTFSGEVASCSLSKDEKHAVRICGLVEDVAVRMSAKGNQFVTFNLINREDRYDMIVFGDVYADAKSFLSNNESVIVDAELQYRLARPGKDADKKTEIKVWQMRVTRISKMSEKVPVLLNKVTFVLKNDEEGVKRFLDTILVPYCIDNTGNTRVGLAIIDDDKKNILNIDLPDKFKTFFPVESFHKIVMDSAVEGYTIDAVQPYKEVYSYRKGQ